MLNQLRELARELGRGLVPLAEQLSSPPTLVEEKSPRDVVTDLDCLLESHLRAWLPTLWPGSSVVGEEQGGVVSEWTWWVDPLDGTTNYVAGLGRSAVSLALYREQQPCLAMIRDPFRQETFVAFAGGGAYLNGHGVSVSQCPLKDSVIAMGFGPLATTAELMVLQKVQQRCRAVRMLGCASLDFAWVACGRLGAYWELDLKPWDVAAGMLIVREAGGVVGDFMGQSATLTSANFLAASAQVFEELGPDLRGIGVGTRGV